VRKSSIVKTTKYQNASTRHGVDDVSKLPPVYQQVDELSHLDIIDQDSWLIVPSDDETLLSSRLIDIDIPDASPVYVSAGKIRLAQICSRKIRSTQERVGKIRPAKVGGPEIGVLQPGSLQRRVPQIRPFEVRLERNDLEEIGFTQDRAFEVAFD
jgi:hypothetical protein